MINWRIYLITDRKLSDDIYDVVEKALKAGVRAVQLREKDLSGRELTEMSERMLRITERYGADLFINDRVDIALSTGAKGVHLGVKGIPVSVARRIAPRLLVGASTHTLEEAMRAEEEGAHFITFGPVYETPSKLAYGRPLGIDTLKDVTSRVKIPVFAIGGIDKKRVKEVIDAGAYGVALIGAILRSEDPERSARELVEEINSVLRRD